MVFEGEVNLVTIRPFKSTDIEAMAELMIDLGYPTPIDKMKKRMELIEATPLYFTFVAEIEGEVIGMMGIRLSYNYEEDGFATQISLLVTKHEYQGRGVGTAFITFIEKWAAERNSDSLYLTSGIKPERVKAHEFYKSLGFDINGYRFVKKI
jgi:GNAT superfamily N-acetyltransferase